MEQSSFQDEQTVRHQFDSLCKLALKSEVINYENNGGYDPMEIFNSDMDIRRVLMQLINGFYSPQNPELFRPIYNSLLTKEETGVADRYFILKDFRSYAEAQKKVKKLTKIRIVGLRWHF